MFRTIEEVQIGGEKAGEAFGGFIYNLGVEIGYNGNPTMVSVNVVSSDGKYNISKKDLSTIRPVKISVGGSEGVIFKKMYLKDYQVTSSPEAKLLNLNYIDRTVWLKKINVGLVGTHGNPHTLRGVKANQIKKGEFKTKIPIQCFPCSYADSADKNGRPLTMHSIKFKSNHGFAHNVDKEMGGMILIGTEEFGKNNCDLKQTTYNWAEFAYVLKKIGVEILKNPDTGEPSITDRGKVINRERFTGPLDEVLSQWCDKMGYSWGFDPETNKIYGVDLLHPIDTLQEVKNKINNLNEKSKIIVTESSESNTLDGTKIHRHISAIKRPFHLQESSDTSFALAKFNNIKIQDILGDGYYGGGRTLEELIISSVLAKYSSDARKIYNMLIAREKAREQDNNLGPASWSSADGDNYLEPLGMTAGYHLNKKAAAGALASEHVLYVNQFALNPGAVQGGDFENKFGLGADIFVGTYSKALESRWEDWEKSIADFIGKYYWTQKPAVGFDWCGPLMEIHRDLGVEPKSTMHTTADKNQFPWYKMLENHPTTAISAIGSHSFTVMPKTCQDGNPAGEGFTVVAGGPNKIIRGATYIIKHTCDPLAANTTDVPPVPRANKGPVFKFFTNAALTVGLKGHETIPNPGGAPKVQIKIPSDAPNIIYWKKADDTVGQIQVTNDPQQQGGQSEIWVHTSQSTYGTSMTDFDRNTTDGSGKSVLESLVAQYDELEGYAASTLMSVLQGAGIGNAVAAAQAIEGDGYKPIVFVIPSAGHIAGKFKVTGLECCANNPAEKVYENTKKQPPTNRCGDFVCNTNFVESFCRCVNPSNRVKVQPQFVGKMSTQARYIQLKIGGKDFQIILPVEHPIRGYHIINQHLKMVHRAIEKFWGSCSNAGNTMGLSVKVQDITNDLEEQAINMEDVNAKIENYSSTDGKPGVAGGGKVRKDGKIIVPDKSWAGGSLQYTAIHPSDYHAAIDHSFDAVTPTEKFTCSVLGLDFSEIKEVMKPSRGLTSMSISYDADGVQTQLAFSSRLLGGNEAALLKEQTFHRLEPLIMLNKFGRTF